MTINEIRDKLKETGYIPTDDICYAVFGMLALNKPLLVEGAPGVGKTSLAKALAEVMGLPMLRLQMYDGLTKDEVLYDYDYQRHALFLPTTPTKDPAARKIRSMVIIFLSPTPCAMISSFLSKFTALFCKQATRTAVRNATTIGTL